VIGRGEPGDDRRRARSEPESQRDLAADPKGQPIGRVKALEGANHQVVAPLRKGQVIGLDGELVRLGHLDLQVQRHRRRHDVITRSQVGGRSWDPNQPAPFGHLLAAFWLLATAST
jgi:hypothetical protein